MMRSPMHGASEEPPMAEPSRVPKPTPATDGTDLGDEYLFYDRENDQVHVLNATAREVFLLCDGRRTEEEIEIAFAARYEVDEATARRDARETLQRLYELRLLTG
jgi:PqqD family protein of HPr-rel-A system